MLHKVHDHIHEVNKEYEVDDDNLQTIEVRGQETRKERMSHDFISNNNISSVVIVMMMLLKRRVVGGERKRMKLPISCIHINVHDIHRMMIHRTKLTETVVSSKP